MYNLILLQAYKIEVSRRSLTAILDDPVGFTKMTSYSLHVYLLQAADNVYVCCHFIDNLFLLKITKLNQVGGAKPPFWLIQSASQKMTSYSLLLYLL